MPRPMLKTPQAQTQTKTNVLNTMQTQQQQKQQQKQVNRVMQDKLLRKSRSKAYMDAMHKLDAGGHVHNQALVKEIIDAIQEEFPEVTLEGELVGIVSKCYLGDSYQVHTLDYAGGIIEHYRRGEAMPNGLDRARNVAMRGNYDFIEVYTSCCRCIGNDGSVSVIMG